MDNVLNPLTQFTLNVFPFTGFLALLTFLAQLLNQMFGASGVNFIPV
jgi:hypothetical protein